MLTHYVSDAFNREPVLPGTPEAAEANLATLQGALGILTHPDFESRVLQIAAHGVKDLIAREEFQVEPLADEPIDLPEVTLAKEDDGRWFADKLVLPGNLHNDSIQDPLGSLIAVGVGVERARVAMMGLRWDSGAYGDLAGPDNFFAARSRAMQSEVAATINRMMFTTFPFTGDDGLPLGEGFGQLPSQYSFEGTGTPAVPEGLTSEQMHALGTLDGIILGKVLNIAAIHDEIVRLNEHLGVPMRDIEQALRGVGSPVFLQAARPQTVGYGRATSAESGQLMGLGLLVNHIEDGNTPSPSRVLRYNQTSYLDNLTVLEDAGVLSDPH
jgi:hypothetical protein